MTTIVSRRVIRELHNTTLVKVDYCFKLLGFVFMWSCEVRISGHGAHGSMQDDELYILTLRSWV